MYTESTAFEDMLQRVQAKNLTAHNLLVDRKEDLRQLTSIIGIKNTETVFSRSLGSTKALLQDFRATQELSDIIGADNVAKVSSTVGGSLCSMLNHPQKVVSAIAKNGVDAIIEIACTNWGELHNTTLGIDGPLITKSFGELQQEQLNEQYLDWAYTLLRKHTGAGNDPTVQEWLAATQQQAR